MEKCEFVSLWSATSSQSDERIPSYDLPVTVGIRWDIHVYRVYSIDVID